MSDRGGADWNLLGLIAGLRGRVDQHLAAGRVETPELLDCPSSEVNGLDARDSRSVDLEELAHRLHPDIVHVHNVVNPQVLEWAVGRRSVLTVQDHRFFCPGRGKWTEAGAVCLQPLDDELCAGCFEAPGYFHEIFALTQRRLAVAQRFNTVTVLSRYMKNELVHVGLTANQVQVVPPFVHGLPLLETSDEPPCVLFVGRAVAAKGVRDVLLAWQQSGVALPLRLAGTGTLRAELEEAGAEVLGWVDRSRLAALYATAQVVVLPSRWQEPFGIVGLEALRAGVPVAAWRTGGVAEWHPGGPGLVEWGDVEALAQAIAELVGQRATPAEGFDCEDSTERLHALYRAL